MGLMSFEEIAGSANQSGNTYSDGQILRTSFGKKSENRHSGDVLSMGFKKSS